MIGLHPVKVRIILKNCSKPFKDVSGLQNHQSRDTVKNHGCHRLQVLRERIDAINEHKDLKERVKQVNLKDNHANVSMGPHKKGPPINAG